MTKMCSLNELLRMRARAEIKQEWARMGELDRALLNRGFTVNERCMQPIYQQLKLSLIEADEINTEDLEAASEFYDNLKRGGVE